MPGQEKGRSKIVSVTSAEVRRVVGPVSDDTICAVLETEPSMEELEVAASYLQGSEVLGHPMAGKVAQLYDILSSDVLYTNDER